MSSCPGSHSSLPVRLPKHPDDEDVIDGSAIPLRRQSSSVRSSWYIQVICQNSPEVVSREGLLPRSLCIFTEHFPAVLFLVRLEVEESDSPVVCVLASWWLCFQMLLLLLLLCIPLYSPYRKQGSMVTLCTLIWLYIVHVS